MLDGHWLTLFKTGAFNHSATHPALTYKRFRFPLRRKWYPIGTDLIRQCLPERSVDNGRGTFLLTWKQVRVDVQGYCGIGVTCPGGDNMDRHAAPQQVRYVSVAQAVESNVRQLRSRHLAAECFREM